MLFTGNMQGVNQLSQLVAMQQRAAAGGGNNLQSPRPLYPASLSPMVPNQQQMQNNLSVLNISRALSPQPHLSQPIASLAKHGGCPNWNTSQLWPLKFLQNLNWTAMDLSKSSWASWNWRCMSYIKSKKHVSSDANGPCRSGLVHLRH